ncbi:hypothetical protein MTX78_11610 [Hymenobacter tibetensis]|uniref:DUF4136 domain-containing protein n=1 Tax=Hymenobacter tibetensis TaxID=497967 RepID=A0ABY4CYL0_9BACT|nr:hypothetical protein [Hymenobacter tibetensis]UOG72773.1 hypothetical protein MTX78_11610 [Hymenobacter tibetensis]
MAHTVFRTSSLPTYSWLQLGVCTLLFSLCAVASQAQLKDDHLLPAKGLLAGDPPQDTYYLKVQETLYVGLDLDPIARLVVLPSFQPEYVISIDQKGNKYYLTYNQASKSIWSTTQAQSSSKVEAQAKSVEISKEMATTVGMLFNTALDQVRYPEPVMRITSDGTTYTFIASRAGNGVRAGETWSPDIKSKMSTLVAVAESLKERAATPTNQQLEQDLIQQAKQLTTELRVEK